MQRRIFFLLISFAVFLFVVIVGVVKFRSAQDADTGVNIRNVREEERGSGEERYRANVFTLDSIEGIQDVYSAVSKIEIPEKAADKSSVRLAVLPHHTLAAEKITEFWKEIFVATSPEVIVLIGPAHENQGEKKIQTARGLWQTPFGEVKTDDDLILQLVKNGVVSEEPDSFVNEHSIGVHAVNIAKLYPNVPIVPIIAHSIANEYDARRLASALQSIVPENALYVASIDFSHYLPLDESEKMDKHTLELIEKRIFHQIDGLSSEYVDSPFSLNAYLMINDSLGLREELIWHENIGRLLGTPEFPTTSYFVFFSFRF